MEYFIKKDNSIVFKNNGETIRIEPWGKNSLRTRATYLSNIKEGEIALLKAEYLTANIEIEDEFAYISNGNITAQLKVIPDGGCGATIQIEYKNGKGETLLKDIFPGGALHKKPRQFKAISGDSFKVKQIFESDPNEKIYGMGQYQQEIINLKGCNFELAHRNSQASIPFYISSKGYGFLWHNAAIGEAHFGLNTTEWVAETTKQLDYWITAGDTPAEILANYTEVTGKPPMMPEYGLGYWQCKLRYYSQEEVLRIAREHKKRNIPLDVIIIDYYHWVKCGDFRFDEEFFPDPKAMVEELKDMGIRTMVSFWPQVDWKSENFEEMRQQGMLVKSTSGVDVQMAYLGNNIFLDPTNPTTRKYVWEKCKKNYYNLGIENFWLDEAEPEFIPYDYERYRYHMGAVTEIGNVYPREYERLFYEGLQQEGVEDVVSLCRCAWVGSQRYGALVWSGDIHSTYEDFRKQICAGIHMGLCGIPWWTTDIGGFANGNVDDEDFRELLVRWFQYGTFLPVMRMHGSRRPHTKIVDKTGKNREVTGADNEIWSFGEENYKIMRKFIDIRELMRNYTRSLMKEAHEKGTPVIRALFYEFPKDKKSWDIKDQYMFGGDILVAPICYEKAISRKVYLPEGAKWTFASDGKVYNGGTAIEVDAPIESIPIFLKNGNQSYLIGKI